MDARLDAGARYIIEKLNIHGKRADIVGGCVRDCLLGKEPFDFDITTEATPDEMKEIFASERVIETGIKHGTLTVLYNGVPYEVTTYREDGEYLDHRHPVGDSFSKNIEEDLSRRDFTVNAIAYNERDGVTDLFGGLDDLRNGIIRAVGDPEKRFDEDALRILRAIRFSATLGFRIEKRTADAARALSVYLSDISGERIYAEWKKLVSGDFAYGVISDYPEIIEKIIGFKPMLPSESAFSSAEPFTRILALFADIPNASLCYKRYCERLRTDARTLRIGTTVLENLGRKTDTLKDQLFALRDIGAEALAELIRLQALFVKTCINAPDIYKLAVSGRYPYTVGMLNVRGDDIISLGFCGKEVGRVLSHLLEAVISDEIPNDREALLNSAKSYTDNT